jgi:hypothetical protein
MVWILEIYYNDNVSVRYADMFVHVCAEIWSRAYCIFPKTTHGKFYVAHEIMWL